ncbi:MAG: PLP-dependent aminotransferase family protein, partial [bacterium]|nr:PLP-dependent aminotransferase family protein [bacterium]
MKSKVEKQGVTRYLSVYHYYKELIMSEKMVPGTKLPSIRKGAAQFQVSRTTMESAYLLLAAEGYIISRPQSGYYVTDIAKKQNRATELQKKKNKKKEAEIQYDFVSFGVDKESFPFELWRRYMKSALRKDERLLSYGEPQGELEFREVLCNYLQEKRSVICSPDQIVVGAGVQSLLNILCPILKERKKVSFYNPDFKQGITVFEDYGFEITDDYRMEEDGIYYITPSQMSQSGEVMNIHERRSLIAEAAEKNILLIEDDFNQEFRYFQKPAPSLQGLAAGKDVIYLGSFSKMLLPSIRMSFMVLPADLQERYEGKKAFYNQTASKAEQIALTQFIRDGHLESQIRKSRKIHLAKANELAAAAKDIWKGSCEMQIEEAGFHVCLEFESRWNAIEIAKRAKREKIAVIPVGEEDGRVKISFSTANVAVHAYREVLEKIKELS